MLRAPRIHCKRGGGRRYYRPEDVLLLRGIRHLLYEEGYTIHGVQRILRDRGVRHDLIDSVFAVKQADGALEDDLVRLLARVDALKEFLATADGANVLVAYRRAANILRIEEKKDARSYDAPADPALLTVPEEKALDAALGETAPKIAAALAAEKFTDAMRTLSALRAPVDRFFDKVTVNCDDANLRVNRLRLLSRIRAALGGVADFAKIEG